MARIALAVEAEDDRVGVEGRAVVEAHVVAQVEGPDAPVGRLLPRLGQRRLDLGRVAAVAHQVIEDLLGHLGRFGVGDARRIERDGVGAAADEHGRVVDGLAGRAAGQRRESNGIVRRARTGPRIRQKLPATHDDGYHY